MIISADQVIAVTWGRCVDKLVLSINKLVLRINKLETSHQRRQFFLHKDPMKEQNLQIW